MPRALMPVWSIEKRASRHSASRHRGDGELRGMASRVRSNMTGAPAAIHYELFAAASRRLRVARLVRRSLGWVFFAMSLVFLFGGRSWKAGLGCGSMPLVLAVWFWIDRRVRRAGLECYQHLYKMGYAVCPACEYDLQSVPQVMKCPECGRNVGPEQCWAAWHAKLRLWCGPGAVVPPDVEPSSATASNPPPQTSPLTQHTDSR